MRSTLELLLLITRFYETRSGQKVRMFKELIKKCAFEMSGHQESAGMIRYDARARNEQEAFLNDVLNYLSLLIIGEVW